MENYADQPRPLTVTLDNSAPYVATRLHAKESLSDGTWLEVHFLSPSPPDQALPGKMVVVTCHERTFAGLAQQIECDGFHPDKQLYFYRLTAVDPLTFLCHGRQRRLFQNQNSRGQISTLLSLHQLTAFIRFSLSGEGETRPCVCQMDESDSAMIRRIMAGQGWFCLRNPDNTTQWTITDGLQHAPSAGEISARLITPFRACRRVSSGVFSAESWSQEQHHSRTEQHTLSGSGTTQQTHYYDGQSATAQFAGEAAAVAAHYYEAGSAAMALCAGMRFRLNDHPAAEYNGEYYISEITHAIDCGESSGSPGYSNTFRCHQTRTPFRMPPVPAPRYDGIQAATVVARDGDETCYDAQGRVKVRFHWEEDNQDSGLSQAWLPVLSHSAGAGAGIQFLPRAGDAVVVQFLNGDPDKPVVTGALWHQNHARPFTDPLTGGIYSRSSPAGARGDGNQVRFEDKRDEECLALSAQKDLTLSANNDWTTRIKGNIRCETEKNLTISSKENTQHLSDKQWQLKAAEGIAQNSGKNLALQADSALSADAKTITLSASQTLTLTAGGSKIELSASGITLQAPQITLKGNGKIGLESAVLAMSAQAKAQLSGALVEISGSAMTEVKAGAMVQISGALTKIN
ncbi:TPA: type VI secretion system tip protein VgrG [Morganella morganii]|uniref:type VI secretion system Vgr family protein n=1 Tax=Morganella morganii TaxID=582 RepID=UPI00298D623E|nr:type VI secretion system tip protein TssI/VgrG [Morganella morganii]MDW7783625.1 type VI secretion system tip protein TssI/VgrG [Morganella morganii]MDW7788954.1 type VI secretion system tip protein TssI/VgrG [Morganella morganii]HCR3227677.1 type VI secretion system tip protein VgrG [Morganella morganii]